MLRYPHFQPLLLLWITPAHINIHFSLDSKEKEEKKGLRLRQKPTVCDLSSTLVFPILHRLWIRSITATNVRTDPHILGMNRKTVTFERFRASND